MSHRAVTFFVSGHIYLLMKVALCQSKAEVLFRNVLLVTFLSGGLAISLMSSLVIDSEKVFIFADKVDTEAGIPDSVKSLSLSRGSPQRQVGQRGDPRKDSVH